MLALLYATYIIKGLKKFSDVPALLKDDVRQALIDADMEHLTN
mgnify:CR=1 FL=1